MVALDVFRAISNWEIYPKVGKMGEYLYTTPNINRVISGDHKLVIGRKGTGKSAIAQYINEKLKKDAVLLNFSDFPFDSITAFEERDAVKNFAYVNAWKYVILLSYLYSLLERGAFDELYRRELSKILTIDPRAALAKSAKQWSGLNFSLSIFGVGGSLSGGKENFAELTIFEKVNCLEEILQKARHERDIFILFDELDLKFRLFEENEYLSDYSLILCSLFRAITQISSDLSPYKEKIKCIAFVRDDIFDTLRDPDKNKWIDNACTLSWSQIELEEMCVYTILKQTGISVIFHDLFRKSAVKSKILSKKAPRPVGIRDYFFENTHLRPRDTIMQLRELSRALLPHGKEEIAHEEFSAISDEYSSRFRQEIIDEVYTVFPEIEDVFDELTKSRRVRGPKEYLKTVLSSLARTDAEIEKMCQLLYYFSIIGLIGNQGTIYRYMKKGSKPIGSWQYEIHPALRKAINFVG